MNSPHLRIAQPLGLCCGLLIGLILVQSMWAWLHLQNMSDSLHALVDQHYPQVALLHQLKEEYQATSLTTVSQPANGTENQSAAPINAEQIAQLSAKLPDKGRALLADVLSLQEQNESLRGWYWRLIHANRQADATTFLQAKLEPSRRQYQHALSKLTRYQDDLLARDSAFALSQARQAHHWLTNFTLIALIVALVVSGFFIRSISQSVNLALAGPRIAPIALAISAQRKARAQARLDAAMNQDE